MRLEAVFGLVMRFICHWAWRFCSHRWSIAVTTVSGGGAGVDCNTDAAGFPRW